jgi:hypothetical protein
MRGLSHLFLIVQSVILSAATPLYLEERDNTSGTLAKRADWNQDDLNKEFKGLWWNNAVKDCSSDQLDRLVYTARYMQKMLDLPLGNPETDIEYKYTKAWDRYIGDYPVWLKQGYQGSEAAAQIERTSFPPLQRVRCTPADTSFV